MNREEMNKIIGMTEEEMDQESYIFENDLWDSSILGEPRSGSPSRYCDSMNVITIREPDNIILEIEGRAAKKGYTKSQYIHELIRKDLAKA